MKTTTLIYSITGNGKTSLAATAPHPILFLDIEARSANIHPNDLPGIDIVVLPTIHDVEMALLKNMTLAKEGKLTYKTIVIDSLREIQRFVIDEYKKQYSSEKDKFTVWDKAHTRVHGMIRMFRDFAKLYNINVVFTCPAFDAKDGDNLEQVPLLEGADKFIKEVMGSFDAIFYVKPIYDGVHTTYSLITRDTGKIRAKTPSRTLETVLDITEGKPNRWTLAKILQSGETP